MPDIRNASAADIEPLALLWHEGWQEAHAPILPPELARFRTLESFRQRMAAALADVRVCGTSDDPAGFSLLKGDELNQLYVCGAARGTGVAAALLTDAENQLRLRGVETAWLACAIGNDRAARFYSKHGWKLAGNRVIQVPASAGTCPLEIWRYEKPLLPGRT